MAGAPSPRLTRARAGAALGGEDDDAALLRAVADCRDEEEEAILRELGLSGGGLGAPSAAGAAAVDAEPQSYTADDVARLAAAVASTRRDALAHKQAGRLQEAREALRASKQLQAEHDAAAAHVAEHEQEAAGEEDPELLAQLRALEAANAASERVGGAGVVDASAQSAVQPAVTHVPPPAPPPAPPPQLSEPVPAPAAEPPVAPHAPAEPPAAPAAAPGTAEVSTREAVLAAKREAVALKRAGDIPAAKAALARAKELERQLAQ